MKVFFQKIRILYQNFEIFVITHKGTFLSERTDVFVITPNRRTFFFPETEIFNFGDF